MRDRGDNVHVTVIVCTYGRDDHVRRLSACLAAQSYPEFDVVIVSGGDPREGSAAPAELFAIGDTDRMRVLNSPRGLTRQRNRGLREARGDLVCFLDDDAIVGPGFLDRVVAIFADPVNNDLGGITAYDVLNYPQRITGRWRLRRLLRLVPSLEPGDVDRLGRAVPLSFALPGDARVPVRWLAGFCMVYRREAIRDLAFDEQLPTYAGEDRDFSTRVGRTWRLLLCGDLHAQHLITPAARETCPQRVYQMGFGFGRTFRKQRTRAIDWPLLAYSLAGEFTLDVVAWLRKPTREGLSLALARPRGVVAGLRSEVSS